MSLVVYLALVASAWAALRHGPARALLGVWLPVVLLLPECFRAITPGLPDPTFSQAAMVPLLAVTVLRHGAGWRPRAMDLMVLAFAGLVGWSDYSARGYDDAQNLMFAMLFSVVGPYFVARLLIGSAALDVAVARRFVILVFAVALVGLYEFRFGANPFHMLLRPLFPGQGLGWVTTFRHGVARVAGPYSHAILAGIMMVMAYRLHRWLQHARHWEPRFGPPLALPWDKARVLTVVLFVGTLMTVARGPWIGALAGAAIVAVGQAADRPRALRLAIAGLTVGALAGAWLLAEYLDVRPGAAITASQESAMYRKELVEKYLAIALDRAWLGWGLTTWPKVRGMPSIDNYWLLLSLMHGVPAMLLLLGMLVLGTAQCIRLGWREPREAPSPAFTMAGVFVAVVVSLGTVYLGEQVLPVVFFLLGWAQALVARPVQARVARPAQARVAEGAAVPRRLGDGAPRPGLAGPQPARPFRATIR